MCPQIEIMVTQYRRIHPHGLIQIIGMAMVCHEGIKGRSHHVVPCGQQERTRLGIISIFALHGSVTGDNFRENGKITTAGKMANATMEIIEVENL